MTRKLREFKPADLSDRNPAVQDAYDILVGMPQGKYPNERRLTNDRAAIEAAALVVREGYARMCERHMRFYVHLMSADEQLLQEVTHTLYVEACTLQLSFKKSSWNNADDVAKAAGAVRELEIYAAAIDRETRGYFGRLQFTQPVVELQPLLQVIEEMKHEVDQALINGDQRFDLFFVLFPNGVKYAA